MGWLELLPLLKRLLPLLDRLTPMLEMTLATRANNRAELNRTHLLADEVTKQQTDVLLLVQEQREQMLQMTADLKHLRDANELLAKRLEDADAKMSVLRRWIRAGVVASLVLLTLLVGLLTDLLWRHAG